MRAFASNGRCKVRRRAGVLVRFHSCSDDVADRGVRFGRDKCGESLAGLLVPDAAIAVLHREHPVEVPFDFVENIRHRILRFGYVEREAPDARAEQLPGPEERAARDRRVHDISTVITSVVPAAR